MSDVLQKNIDQALVVLSDFKNNQALIETINNASKLCSNVINGGGKLLICGNGGSAADSQHFAAELIGRFYFDRQPLPAIALSTDSSILTCVGNDYSFSHIFSRQVEALCQVNDLVFGISTSGNSENVMKAFQAAKKIGAKTMLLTGNRNGSIESISDIVIQAPSSDTARIQEMHLLIEHSICESIEIDLGIKP